MARSKDHPVYICAFSSQVREGIADKLEPVVPDARLKDPLKIEESIQKRTAERNAKMAVRKLTGEVTRALVYSCETGELFDSLDESGPAAVSLMKYLDDSEAFADCTWHLGEHNAARFVGIDVREMLGLASVAALQAGRVVPAGLWCGNTDVFDPYELLVEADMRPYFTHAQVFNQLGIPVPENYVPHQEPAQDLLWTIELCVRLGLIFADTAGVMADLGNMLGEDAGDEDVEEDFDDVDAEPVTEEQTA